MTTPPIAHIHPRELRERLDRGDDLFLIDVREPWEFDTASIPGSHLFPLGELTDRVQEFIDAEEVVVICHHGVRSFQGAQWLREFSFKKIYNLTGGIDAWSQIVDASVPRY
jgi:rhodanese-related sulfurtransferase